MNYDVPITTAEHAQFCLDEAKRRYHGKIIRDKLGMLLVQDNAGTLHTDDVLRALSAMVLVEE